MKTIEDLTLDEAKEALDNAAWLLWDRWDDCPECDHKEYCAGYEKLKQDPYANVSDLCQQQILQGLFYRWTRAKL